MSDTHGTDALRMALVFSTAAGSDIPLAEDKIKGMKHFANKLWNIARFILARVPAERFADTSRPEPATDADRAILEQLDDTVASATTNLDRYALHGAAQRIYQFAWHELADVYLEASKGQLDDSTSRANTEAVLAWCLTSTLTLLHPFMPFVTEELWGRIHGTNEPSRLLMVAPWPTANTSK
jgi:valyl-tRNA synthetase